jgi:two-component system NarL family sensor kinase
MKLLSMQDQERRRIARVLHDTTSQNMAALQMNLTLIEQSAALPERLQQALAESVALAQTCALEIRALSYSLHPPLLDELGLVAALRAFAVEYTRRSGVILRLDLPEELGELSPEVAIGLFRIAEEALSKIQSGIAVLRLKKRRSSLLLELIGSGNLGGAIIRARVRELRGELVIKSSPGGTRLRVVTYFGCGTIRI